MKGVKFINKVPVIFLALIILLSSCNEGGGYLLSNDEVVHLDITSMTDGELLRENDLIHFKILANNNDYNPDKLEIEILTQAGDLAASTIIDSPEVNQSLNVKIPSLKNAQFDLVLSLYSESNLVVREMRTFFKIDDYYQILSIQSLPVVINSGAPALLIADISAPENSDPYMRWSQGDKIIARGYLNEEFSQILWKAPQEEGVYSINVEIFPFSPRGQIDFPFQAHDTMSAELFVTKALQTKKQALYNLHDIYWDSEWDTNPQKVLSKGIKKPSFVIRGDTIGFKFKGTAGIILPEMILPVENNLLSPFTLSLGITFTAEQYSRDIITINSLDSKFVLKVLLNQDSIPTLYINLNNQEFYYVSGIDKLEWEKRYLLEFSVIPKQDTIDVICRVDAEKTASFQDNILITEIKNRGASFIGGKNGFMGIIDKLDITTVND